MAISMNYFDWLAVRIAININYFPLMEISFDFQIPKFQIDGFPL